MRPPFPIPLHLRRPNSSVYESDSSRGPRRPTVPGAGRARLPGRRPRQTPSAHGRFFKSRNENGGEKTKRFARRSRSLPAHPACRPRAGDKRAGGPRALEGAPRGAAQSVAERTRPRPALWPAVSGSVRAGGRWPHPPPPAVARRRRAGSSRLRSRPPRLTLAMRRCRPRCRTPW